MDLEIIYSPQFADNLEAILRYFDERNGSDVYSRKLFGMIHRQIRMLATFPEIGRQTNFQNVRVLFVESYGIEYQIRDTAILIADIYSCKIDPSRRRFKTQ